jgi:hypothetical protein
MKRKDKDVLTTRWASARLAETEHQALLQAQQTFKLKRSVLVRNMIREWLGMGLLLLPEERELLRQFHRQLSALGRNLNQVRRVYQAGHQEDPSMNQNAVEALSKEILELKGLLTDVLGRP